MGPFANGATDATITSAFMTLVNPGAEDVSLVTVSTSVATMCQIHEMVKSAAGTLSSGSEVSLDLELSNGHQGQLARAATLRGLSGNLRHVLPRWAP